MKKSIVSSSFLQTKNIAKVLAETLLESPGCSFTQFEDELLERPFGQSSLLQPRKGARVLALAGELGSGKTTFAQGFAKGLGIQERILSPTFILIRCHKLRTKNYKLFYHIDCYRLDNPAKELLHLGFKKIIADPRNVVAVEWADRIQSILPKDILWVRFAHMGKNRRRITIR